MRRTAESGMWEPDSLEWVEEEKLFEDWVAVGEQEAQIFLESEEEAVA